MSAIIGWDHIVLRGRDVEAALHFYGDVLGMEKLRVLEWREGKVGFPSVRVSDDTLIDLLAAENKPADDASNNNLNHFRLLVSPRDLKGLLTRLKRERVTPDRKPRPRWGAHGSGTSVYIHDPNGNQIELKTFP